MSEIKLTKEQNMALDGMFRFGLGWEVAVLEGVAGSGKTYTIDRFIDAIAGSKKIAVACPTWKALSVITEHHHVDYMTIHSLLGLRLVQLPGGATTCVPYGRCKLSDYDIVVVDESSMIGPDLFDQLIDPAKRQGAFVLFVGDPHQLAPVIDDKEDDAMVLSPVFSVVSQRWRLNDVVRQAEDNPIIQASVVIRSYIERGERIPLDVLGDALAAHGGADKRVAGVVSGSGVTVVSFAAERLAVGDDVRVLCYTNERVKTMNAAIHLRIYGTDSAETGGFEIGERVVMQEEYGNAGASLKNAEELIIENVIPEHNKMLGYKYVTLWLRRIIDDTITHVPVPVDRVAMDRYIRHLFNAWRSTKYGDKRAQDIGIASNARAWQLVNQYANVRHAYASTVHKSQGSTYDTAIVDWQDCMRMREDHEFNRAIYVGITRPREKLAVVG